MGTRSQIENIKIKHNGLLLLLMLSIVANVFLSRGVLGKLDNLTLHIPPDVRQGEFAELSIKDIPEYSIYSFAQGALQWIYNWENNGEDDYRRNLARYRNYMTQRFYTQLKKDYDELLGRVSDRDPYDPIVNQLTGITKFITPWCHERYTKYYVKRESDSAWLVRIRVTHRDEVVGRTLRTVPVEYVMRVVRYEGNDRINEQGLLIDGWVQPPRKITEKEIKDECKV